MKFYAKFKLISILVGLVCFFSATIAYADLEVNTIGPHLNERIEAAPEPRVERSTPKGAPEIAVNKEIAVLFLHRCGPTEDIARFLQVNFGEIPFLEGLAFQHTPEGSIYEGKIMITMNPATKSYTINFVIGGMACVISNGANLNVAGINSQATPNP